HQPAYSPGSNNFPSGEDQFAESSVGSVPFKNTSLIVDLVKRDGSRPVSAQISRRVSPSFSFGGSSGCSLRRSSCIIVAQSGEAERTANVSRIGRPSKFP